MRTHLSLTPLLALTLALSTGAWAAEPVGPQNCKTCHPEAYRIWRDSQHAAATASLNPTQLKDGRCLSCHAPLGARGVSGVSCESCHGGGQYYAPRYVMKDKELARAVGLVDPSEKTCLKCHDASAPSLKPFVFADKLKAIDHWTAERAARAARVGAAP